MIVNHLFNLFLASAFLLVNKNNCIFLIKIVVKVKVEEILCFKVGCSLEAFNACLGVGNILAADLWEQMTRILRGI